MRSILTRIPGHLCGTMPLFAQIMLMLHYIRCCKKISTQYIQVWGVATKNYDVAPSFLYQTLTLSTSSTSWLLSSASSVSQSISSYHCCFLTVFRLPKLWSRSQLLICGLNLTDGTQTVWYMSNKQSGHYTGSSVGIYY